MARYRRRRGYGRDPVPLLLVQDGGDGFLSVLAALGRGLFRLRSELAPLAAGVAVAVTGGWLHAQHPGWWPWLALTATVGAVGVLLVPGRWLPGWAVLDRTLERVYAALVTAFIGGWLAAATRVGPGTDPLLNVLVIGAAILAVPWWTHHRRRARVRVERVVEGWPAVAEATGLAGSRVVSALATMWGYTLRLALARGQTVKALIDKIPSIESALATRPGAVRVEPDGRRADRALLRVVERDPHAEPVPWPTSAVPSSVTRPVGVGLWEDGNVVTVPLLRRHVLVGGVMGSGKSGVLNVLLAALTGCPDVLLWGIDLKQGMELRPWRDCLEHLATTGPQAVELLRAAVLELNRRAAHMAATGQRVWEPTPDAPALVIVIDEYAELDEQAHELADSIARRGRAVAVTLVAATQRPTQKAMGQGAVRSQMDVRICLRVRERRDTDLVLGAGMLETGWHAHMLDAPGKFLLSAPEHTTPRRARAYHMTDQRVQEIAGRHTTTRPPDPTPGAHDTGDTVTGKTTTTTPGPHRNDDDPEMILWGCLRRAPTGGVTIIELIAATGRSRSWVYARLNEHATTGRALQVRRGSWRATPTEHTP